MKGIVARLRSFKEIFNDIPMTNPKAWDTSLWRLIGSQSLSGENVTEQTALTYSAWWNGVILISGTTATLPLHLIRENEKSKVWATEQQLFKIMYAKPNPYMTSKVFREVMMAHILTWGNAYAEIVRDGMNQIQSLWPIPPNRIKPLWINNEIWYEIDASGKKVTLPRDRILNLHGLGFDGFTGYSIVAMARKSIGLGLAMQTFGETYFGNGTHPSAVVTHPGILKDPSKLRDSLTATYSGLGQSHKLMLLEEGMKIENIGIPPEDSQFLQSRQFQITEIAQWFNLPPHKLKDLTRSSFSNIESEQISFVQDSILPWLITLEGEYNTQLLTEDQLFNQKLYFKHNVEGLLRADVAGRGNFYRAMFNIGGMSINEIRSKEDMDPIENGDEHFVPLNMVPLSKINDPSYKQAPPAPPPQESEEKPTDIFKKRSEYGRKS